MKLRQAHKIMNREKRENRIIYRESTYQQARVRRRRLIGKINPKRRHGLR